MPLRRQRPGGWGRAQRAPSLRPLGARCSTPATHLQSGSRAAVISASSRACSAACNSARHMRSRPKNALQGQQDHRAMSRYRHAFRAVVARAIVSQPGERIRGERNDADHPLDGQHQGAC